MKRMSLLSLLAVALLALTSSVALADVIVDYCDDTACYTDPATLQVGQLPLPFPGSDPNLVTGNSFTVFQNQGGASPLNTPWYVILGVPNYTGANPFGAASCTASSLSACTATFDTTKGGVLNPGGEAYSSIIPALQGPYDMSNNFVNWSGAESSLEGITATQFGLYVFDVNATIGAKQYVTFTFGSLPTGTIAIAYGQVITPPSPTCKKNCKPTVTIFDTPFTQAGFEHCVRNCTPTPEPASMLLLSAGALGLLGFRKLRK